MSETVVTQEEQNTEVLENADQIMENALDVAGGLVQERPQSAELILRQILKIDPEHLGGLQMLGLCKHRMGENAEAIEIIQTALDLDPTAADNWNNMGLAYGALGNYDRSIDCLKMALQYKPEQFLYMNNIALQLRATNHHEDAVETLKKALEIDSSPQLLVNLGGIYGEMKQVDNAIDCFKQAVASNPDYPPAHVDLTFSYALQKKWKDAFAEYEWRFTYYPQMSYYIREYDQDKVWNGQDSLEGKTILIYSEQGAGDGIQFIRYTKQLKAMGATVYVHCAPSLNNLFDRIETVDRVVNRDIVNGTGPKFPEYDYQCAIMSLPHLLQDFDISGEPYIKPATDKFKGYLEEEYGKGKFNVGIIWAGSPSHPNDKNRSIHLKHFACLQDIEGVRLLCLQMDKRARAYGSISHPENVDKETDFQQTNEIVDYCKDAGDIEMIDLTTMIQDFEDTATILAGLDLLITCDTAALHLAGAMGVPTWALIPYNPDWRWGLEGTTTEWYDSVKLFRQEEKDNWEQVLEEVRKELNETVLQNK